MFMFDWSALMTPPDSLRALSWFIFYWRLQTKISTFSVYSTVTLGIYLCVIVQGQNGSHYILGLCLRTLAIQGVFSQRKCFSLSLKILRETRRSSKGYLLSPWCPGGDCCVAHVSGPLVAVGQPAALCNSFNGWNVCNCQHLTVYRLTD